MAIKKQEVNDEVMEQEKSQVVVVTDWKQLKKKNEETTIVPLDFPDGAVLGIEIKAISKNTFNVLNEKYEDMKGTPDKVFNKDKKAFEPAKKGSKEYIEWENKCKVLDNLKASEIIITALVNKPEGANFDEQVAFLQDTFKSGQHDKLFTEILKFSGYDLDSKIEDAKN